MKKVITKVLSVLLVVTILATSLPFSTLAAEENAQNDQTISTDMGDMSMTATNSFGEMLTESLGEQTNEQNAGYYISDIKYEGYCALVSFVTQQDCTIRVAVYEEDTGRMVTSASADVLKCETEVVVEFEDELPDYFVLKAFMLDENVAPMCKAYTCNEMTNKYEDFLATTTDDFPEDKVINLDEDKKNNFLVMSNKTTTVTTDGRTNVLISYDETTGVYKFGNIDEQITSLKKGDILYFDNGNVEELTFIKVKTIDITLKTAEITEAETSIEEVFDVVKIYNDIESDDFVIDEDDELEDGITYLGVEEIEDSDDEIGIYAIEDEKEITFNHKYSLNKAWPPKEPKKIGKQTSFTGLITIEGSAGFSVTGAFKYYISSKFSEVEFTLTPKISIDVSIEGAGRMEIKLKNLDYSPCFGVYVGIAPKFVVETSVKASFNATLMFTLGIGYNSNDGFVNKSQKPSFKPKLKIEGKIFIGFDLGPHAYVASEKVAKVELGSEIGAKLTATLSTDNGDNHLCNSCLDGDIDLVGDLTGKLVFGEKTRWENSLNVNFLNIKIDIIDFYYSISYKKFGWGSCPLTNNNSSEPGGNPSVPDDENYDCNKNGCYYTITVLKKATCTDNGKGKYICNYCGKSYIDVIPATGHNFINGECTLCSIKTGTFGGNLTWILNETTGTLTISGSGIMNASLSSNVPWRDYRDNIKKVIIKNGITSICDYAFFKCESLTSVIIPDSVTAIGDYAFHACESFTSVKIPDSVTAIGDYAFCGCDSLTSVTIPDSVTTIGVGAFQVCTNLTSVTIGDSVTTIGDCAFQRCTSLTSVTIPDSVTSIGDDTFAWCFSLKSIIVDSDNQYYSNDEYGVLFNKDKTTLVQYPIGNTRTNYTIPDGVTTIGVRAFVGCNNLTSVTIPDSVTTIGVYAFAYCDNLISITIGDSVTTIGSYSFECCESLTSVKFGDSVTTIGDCAFERCTSLTSVTIPDSVTAIDIYAFANCDSLTSITIPDSVITIGWGSFHECDDLVNVIIGDSVTTIGDDAFEDCDSLTSITVDGNNQYYSNDEYGVLFNKDKTTLVQYPIGNTRTNYTIPDGVTTIGASAFCGCNHLIDVTIPDSVTSIGDGTFAWCTNFVNITIPDSVTTIGVDAFAYCDSLTSITIPDSVIEIGVRAFVGCNSLEDVYYAGTEEQWNEIMIGQVNDSLINAIIHFSSAGSTYSLRFNQGQVLSLKNMNTSSIKNQSATASNAIVGNEYTIVVLKNTADINDFTDNELLYIGQKTAEQNGDITFNYVPKSDERCIVYIIGVFSDSNSVKQEQVSAHIHTEEEIPAVEPTCTEPGFTAGIKCSLCDEVLITPQKIPSFGHEYESDVTAPTCIISGYTTYSCSNCGDSYVSDVTNAPGHTNGDVVEENYVAPTCTENGSKDNVTYCIVCSAETRRETVVVPATGHNYVNGNCTTCGGKDQYYYNGTFHIQTPSTTTIRHKDGIKLHANVEGNAPTGSYVKWTADNNNFKMEEINNGDSLQIISDKNGYTTFTATLYSAEGEILAEETIEMRSKAGFFDKIGGFFRRLFGNITIHEN